MKKIIYRAMSGLCAAMLMVQTMALTAFAEVTPPPTPASYLSVAVGSSDIAAQEKAEVFVLSPAVLPVDGAAIPTITGFNKALDYIEYRPAAGLSVALADNGADTTVTVTDGATSKEALVVKGITATELAARKRPACTAVHSGYTVTANKPAVNIDDATSDTVIMTAVPIFTSSEPTVVHSNPTTHDKAFPAISWTLDGTPIQGISIAAGSGKNLGKGIITVDTGAAVGTHTVTAKATAAGSPTVTGTQTITVTVTSAAPPVCTAQLAHVGVTSQDVAAGGKVEIQSPITQKQFTAVYAFDKAPTDCGVLHSNTATSSNHDKSVTIAWSVNPAVSGVSIDQNGLLTIDRTKLPVGNYSINVTATGTATDDKRAAVSSGVSGGFTFTLSNSVSCTYTIGGITLKNAPTAINADTTASVQYTAEVIYSGATVCNDATHMATGIHTTALWTMTPKDANSNLDGLALDRATGILTVNKAGMTKLKAEINIAATAGTYTQNIPVTITRTLDCNKTLRAIGAITPGAVSPATARLIYERSGRAVFAVPDNVVGTLNFSMGTGGFNGTCGYEAIGQKDNCPKKSQHTVTWTLDNTPAGVVPTATGETMSLTVTANQLQKKQASVGITATVNGISTKIGYIVINKGSYTPPSTGDGGNDNDNDHSYEEQKREEQYEKIEAQIDDADRKDTIKANLSDNPKFPTRIIRDFRGKDVNLELYMGDRFTWHINGKDLKSIPDYQIYISMDVKNMHDSDISDKAKDHDIMMFELGHDGSFYGTYKLEMDVGSSYAKKTVYLYKNIDSSNKLSYKGAAKADENGYATFPFTSASTYVVTDRPLYGETANTVPSGGGTATGGGTGTVAPAPPPASVKPSVPVAPPSSSSSSSVSTSSSEASSEVSSIAPSSEEPSSKPTDGEPEEKPEPEKKKSKIPIIVPILLVVVTVTVVAVILLAKGGGMDIGG